MSAWVRLLDEARHRGIDALCFRLCALTFFVALPIGVIFSNRGSAAIVASAGLLLLIGHVIRHWPDLLPERGALAWRELLRHPVLLLFALFFLLAAISVPFTASPRFHGGRLLEFASPVVVTGAMLFILQRVRFPLQPGWQVFGLVVAAVITILELRNGSPLRGIFGLRVEDWRLNRSVVVLLLLLFPMVALLVSRGSKRWGEAAAMCVALLPAYAIIRSESGSAELGLLVGLATILLASLAWRFVFLATVFAATLAIMTAPWQGTILWDVMPDSLHERMREMSSAIRVDIWRAFGWAVTDAPILGSGFNVAAHLEREPAYQAIPDKLRGFIEFGHAHNAALQIWVEFGLIGALIATALAILTLKSIERASQRLRPAMLAAFNASFAIGIVSHGAWQAWWAGILGALVLLFFLIDREARERSPDRV